MIFSLVSFIYRPWAMFCLSILACVSILIIERFLGIEWNFHPDANTYIEFSGLTSLSIKEIFLGYQPDSVAFMRLIEFNITFDSMLNGILTLRGNLFYVIVDLFNSDIRFVILFNIIIYSITNSAISIFFRNNCKLESEGYLGLLFLFVIFNPYRAHFSVQVLKDTLIISSLVFLTLNKTKVFGIIYFIAGVFLRSGWIIYLISFINIKVIVKLIREKSYLNKNLRFLFIATVLSFLYGLWFVISQWDTIIHVFTSTNGNMTFRDFDSVPSFYELGVVGSVIRAILWPVLYLTGAFIFLSPSIMYLPVAIGVFLQNFWIIKHFKRPYSLISVYLSIFVSMAIFAFIISGFTSYIRYCLPLITILPILLINEDRRQTKENFINKKDKKK